MGSFEYRLVHRAFNFPQSKLLLSLPALPLFLFLLGNSGALVVSLLGALRALFEGSATVFLLVNCVIATIFASSRMESNTASDACKEEKETTNQGECIDASAKIFLLAATDDEQICDNNQDEEDLIRRTSDDNQNEHAFIKGTGERNKEKLPLKKEAENGNEEEAALGKKCENGDQEKQDVVREANHGEDDVLLNSCKTEVLITRAGGRDDINHAPSAEEVWAAIVASKKGSTEDKLHAQNAKEDTAAGTAVALRRAESGAKKLNVETDEEGDSKELEELNRRAEEFIARTNHQMRLQRLESLQRRRQRRSRRCHPHDRHSKPPHLRRVPPAPAAAPSLLVG